MLKEIVSRIWRTTPRKLRLRIIRASQKKFTVSVAAIITDKDSKVLLLDHVLRPFSSWGLPGGFVNVGEQPRAAISREIFEETGLMLTDVELYRIRSLGRHIEILYTAKSEGEARVISREIRELGWFDVEKMPNEMSEAQKQIVTQIIFTNRKE